MDAGLGAHEATLAMVDDAAREAAGRVSGLEASAVEAALDPVRAVAARDVTGGTAPHEVRRMVQRMRDRLSEDEVLGLTRRRQVAQAQSERQAAVAALL